MKNQEIRNAVAEFDKKVDDNNNARELIKEMFTDKFTKEEYLHYLLTDYIPQADNQTVLRHLQEVHNKATIEDVKKAR